MMKVPWQRRVMYTYYDEKLKRNVRILYIGEYTATGDDVYLSTVVGSCVTVALYSQRRAIGGLNHFMLPEGGGQSSDGGILGGAARYGMGAMEFLINELMKLGTRREELSAKVFGGGHVLENIQAKGKGVPDSNIDFAFSYLKTERIPITASDVGDTVARKIFFDPRTAEVLLKRITGDTVKSIEYEEERYLRSLAAQEGGKESKRLF
jgi:chemotaxis protein CheD